MNNQILHTVEGLRDIHPLDTRKKQQIERNILDLFNHYGYEQVQTPTFEYYDIYHYERGTEDSKNLYKFFNREGDILSLRPDVTPSIARYTATFIIMKNHPNVFLILGMYFIIMRTIKANFVNIPKPVLNVSGLPMQMPMPRV